MKIHKFLTSAMALALIVGGASVAFAEQTVKKTVTTTTTRHNAPAVYDNGRVYHAPETRVYKEGRVFHAPDGRVYTQERIVYDAEGRQMIEYYDDETNVVYTTPVTITKEQFVEPRMIAGARPLDFRYLDVNNDGILSRREVGQRLFYVFDTDGNGVLDNIEFQRSSIMTVIPLERTELTMIDLDDDGRADLTQVTTNEFMDRSMLARFDMDGRGVSPESFIHKSFYEVDTDRSGVVEFKEWREVYNRGRSPLNARQYRYN